MDSDGSLAKILEWAYGWRAERQLRRWEFNVPAKAAVNKAFVTDLVAWLRDSGQMRAPRIAFGPAIKGARRKELSEAAKSVGIQVMDRIGRGGALTVVPDPAGPPGDREDEAAAEWLRTLSLRPGKQRVHWWYFPDSYDEWIPSATVDGPSSIDPGDPGKTVTDRFILDSVHYNEWANPADYDPEDGGDGDAVDQEDSSPTPASAPESGSTEEANPAAIMARSKPAHASRVMPKPARASKMPKSSKAAKKPKSSNPSKAGTGTKAARRKRPKSGSPDPGPSSRKKAKIAPSSGISVKSAVGASPDRAGPAHPSQSLTPGADPVREAELVAGSQFPAILPSSAAWFDMESIHGREQSAFPSFFDGSSGSRTPTTYMMARNFMINVYRLNPASYLTFTAARRSLRMDVGTALSIYIFLNETGLINYNVDPRTRPIGYSVPDTSSYPAFVDTPRGLQALSRGPGPSSPLKTEYDPAIKTPAAALAKDAYDFALGRLADPATRTEGANPERCSQCSLPTPRLRYESVTGDGVVLCGSCYTSGWYGPGRSAATFILKSRPLLSDTPIDVSATSSGPAWSEAETLKLLQLVEKHGEDWAAIERAMGRPKEACLERFLSLPITVRFAAASLDTLLAEPDALPAAQPGAGRTSSLLEALGLMVSSVSPGVAEAATKAAFAQLAAEQPDPTVSGTGASPRSLANVSTNIKLGQALALAAGAIRAKAYAADQTAILQDKLNDLVVKYVELISLRLGAFELLERSLERQVRKISAFYANLSEANLRQAQAKAAAVQSPVPK